MNFVHSFVSQFTVVIGTVLSVSVVASSADYCTFILLLLSNILIRNILLHIKKMFIRNSV